jgi:hypothetical protein
MAPVIFETSGAKSSAELMAPLTAPKAAPKALAMSQFVTAL